MNNEEFDYEYLQLVEQQLELDDMQSKVAPCWEGYEMIGMKKGKNGKLVPNCVPIEKKEGKPLKDQISNRVSWVLLTHQKRCVARVRS